MPKKGRIGDRYKKVKISNEKIRQRNKKEYAKIIVLAVFLLVITIGGSYALFQTTIKGNKQTEVVAGTLKVEYEDKNTISLNNASPLTDVEGLNQEPYTFTVRNIGTLNGKYTIYLEEKEGNTLDKSNIKYSIKEGEGDWSSPVLLSSGLVLKENRILEKGEEETYQIKMWLKEDATNEVQGQTYKAKVVVNVVQTNTENIVTTNPVIKLNGESVVKINQNEEYVDAGVSSVSSREEISLDKVKVRYEYNNGETTESVEKIDTSKVGIYYIYYEVEDSKGIKGISTRVVNVVKKGTNTPTIVLKGEEEISLDYKEKYVEAGYEARDVEDGELTDKVVVEGVVNSEVAGTYIIKYIVIDSEGNTASVVRKVIVNGKSQGLTATVKKEEEENISTTVTIEADSESEKAYYAVTTTDKKPGDSEYKELVNKKVSLNIVKNGRYYIFVKDSKGNVVKKTVDITNIDETKPSCSFEDGGYVEKGKTKEIELTCTDPADIATTKIETERIEVSDSEVGEVESISIGEKINKGYKYKITVRGKTSGNFTIKLKGNSVLDKVGNKNEEVESTTAKVVSMNVNTPEIELDLTGTTEKQIEISGTNIGKLSYKSNNKEIAIVTEKGIVRAVSPGVTTITVTEANGKITKEVKVKVIKTITVTFTRNGQGVEKISNTTASCEIKDQTLKCKVKMPSMKVKEGYSKVGWNADKEAKEGYKELEEVDIEKDTEFFTISKKNEIELTTTFKRNGAASLDGKEVEELKKTCIIAAVYNDSIQETSCYVTTPIIEASSATPIVIGYGESKDATAGIVKSNENIEISNDITYYALTKNTPKTVTIQFNKNGAKTQSGKEDDIIEKSCTIPITYNGESQNKTCSITSPIIGASTETPTVIGYSTESSRYVNDWSSNDAKEVGENGKYYAQTKKDKVEKEVEFKIVENSHVTKLSLGSNSITSEKESIKTSCFINETYNGEVQATSCMVESPTIEVEEGYKKGFFGVSSDATTGSSSGEKVTSNNKIYYARALTGNSYTINYYDGDTKKGTTNAIVGSSYELTEASSLVSKEGYTFKGWTTTKESTTVEYNDKQTVKDLTKKDLGVVNLYAVWKDETKPKCSYTTSGSITTGNTTTITMTCTDSGSKIVQKDLTRTDFEVSNVSGSIVSIGNKVAVTNGYSYVLTLKGESVGSFNVSLKQGIISDNSGNKNDKITTGNIEVKGRVYTITYVKGSQVSSISSNSTSFTTTGSATSCTFDSSGISTCIPTYVTLPTIVANNGYIPTGWYNSTGTKIGNSGEKLSNYTLNSDVTLIAKAQDNTPPNAVSISSVSNNGTSLVIDYTGGFDAESGISKYTCNYGTDETLGSSISLSSSSTSCTIPTNKYTTYYYQICSINGVGLSTCSNIENTTTITGVPSSVTYNAGDIITYAASNWKVLSSDTDSVTLIYDGNYATGEYGSNSSWSNSNNAYTKANNLITNNGVINNDKTNGGLFKMTFTNGSSNYTDYTRLPLSSELSTNISNSSSTPFWTGTISSGNSMYIANPEGTKGYTYTKYSTSSQNYYAGYSARSLSTTSLATTLKSASSTIDSLSSSSSSLSIPGSSYSSSTTGSYYGTTSSSKTITSPGTQAYSSWSVSIGGTAITCKRNYTVGSTSSGTLNYCNSSSGSSTFSYSVSDSQNYTSSYSTGNIVSVIDGNVVFTSTNDIGFYTNYFNNNCGSTDYADGSPNAYNYLRRVKAVCGGDSVYVATTTAREALIQNISNNTSGTFGSGYCYPTQNTTVYQFNFGSFSGSNENIKHTVSKNSTTRYYATGTCSKKTVYNLSNSSKNIGIRPVIKVKKVD